MPSPSFRGSLVLIGLGLLLAGSNVWFAAARSTIPLALEGVVVEKTRLTEKIPGVDDVYLVRLDSGRRIQVDGSVFEALAINRPVSKQAWSRTLESDGRNIGLNWSTDFRGLVYAMPLVIGLLFLPGLFTRRIFSARPPEPSTEIARSRTPSLGGVRTSDPANWSVYRQDDNGNRFEVQAGLTRVAAENLVAEMESHGHKQMYWTELKQ